MFLKSISFHARNEASIVKENHTGTQFFRSLGHARTLPAEGLSGIMDCWSPNPTLVVRYGVSRLNMIGRSVGMDWIRLDRQESSDSWVESGSAVRSLARKVFFQGPYLTINH